MRVLVGSLVTLLVLGLAVVVAGVVLFLRPPEGDPHGADAIVALAGGAGERLRAAEGLMDEGASEILVLSHGPSTLCNGGQAYEVICFEPDPGNTRGEAREIGRLASERGWQRVAVVTSTQHVTRSRVLIGQCLDGDVEMVDAGSAFPTNERRLRAIRHELTGLLAAYLVEPAC
jgi:uncharacterized SAM-binding protein YcdF (DUF218 family)